MTAGPGLEVQSPCLEADRLRGPSRGSHGCWELLIVPVALQNELDNVRAQLSQKGESASGTGPGEASDLGAGGRGQGLSLLVCP